jgi:hypothetical protein
MTIVQQPMILGIFLDDTTLSHAGEAYHPWTVGGIGHFKDPSLRLTRLTDLDLINNSAEQLYDCMAQRGLMRVFNSAFRYDDPRP